METWNISRFRLTVHKTRNLRVHSKSGVHDVYAVVTFGREKLKTPVRERCTDAEWNEDCFLKLLSTNDDCPVKIQICHRNFLRLRDETIGSVDIDLKCHRFYEKPKRSWFTLKNKSEEGVGDLLVTLSYMALTPAVGDGRRMNAKDSRNVSLTEFPRDGSPNMVDMDVLTTSFNEMFRSESPEVCMRKNQHIPPGQRHTIDFLSIKNVVGDRGGFDDVDCDGNSVHRGDGDGVNHHQQQQQQQLVEIDLSDPPKVDDHSSGRPKTLITSDSSLTRFDSFDSLQDKRSLDESTSSTDSCSKLTRDDVGSSEESEFEEKKKVVEDEDDDAEEGEDAEEEEDGDKFVEHLNQFTKRELVQLIRDQKEWIRSREVYIIDLHAYVDSLLAKILESNCSTLLLQQNCKIHPPADERHRLTTFKSPEDAAGGSPLGPIRWFRSVFGRKHKNR